MGRRGGGEINHPLRRIELLNSAHSIKPEKLTLKGEVYALLSDNNNKSI